MDFFFNTYFTTTSASDVPEQEPVPAIPVDAGNNGGCVIA